MSNINHERREGPAGEHLREATRVTQRPGHGLSGIDQIKSMLKWSPSDLASGRYRIMLYRFLTEQVPIVGACIWTWVRLAGAPGSFRIVEAGGERAERLANERLRLLGERLYANALENRVGLATLLPDLLSSLFRDGMFGAFLTILPDGSGVDRLLPVDALRLRWDNETGLPRLRLDLDDRLVELDRPDFQFLALSAGTAEPFGRSILQPVPFVSYIEQQLVQDMQRSNHNAGYHRLHVRITPPERLAGESDTAYTSRINSYFDSTVEMIRGCSVDDNPVTWDNVAIEYIGPEGGRSSQSNWFVNHRAMIEDICAGTNLAPYLLGYSYGATTTWSNFKFDVVMRQVRSVQAEVAGLLNRIAAIDLALAGIEARATYEFDNSFPYQAAEKSSIEAQRVENLLKLFAAGLIDEAAAREQASRLTGGGC